MSNVKCVLRTQHTAPVGVYSANGNLVYVNPGREVEVELTEQEAAALINDKGLVRCRRVAEAAEQPPDLTEGEAEGEAGTDEADAPSGRKTRGRGRG